MPADNENDPGRAQSELGPDTGKRIRFCVLASGSRGNSVWVESDGAAVIVDNGLSGKAFKQRVALAGLDIRRLKAIIVSHEHRDHILGVGVLARMMKLPVYLNEATYKQAESGLGRIHVVPFVTGVDLRIGHLAIHPFSISHDAADTAAFTFQSGSAKLGLATDLGTATALVKRRLAGCDALILEANHDPDMLRNGPYPWEIKRRVRGRQGHLSNQDAAELLAGLVHSGLRHVVLAHLSQTNNLPDLALETVGAVQSDRTGFRLEAASQDQPGSLVEI